jgi:hypothetical protein
MLLGCCHCGETPPSESTPPSVSDSSIDPSSEIESISEVSNTCSRENCISEVFARRYRVTWGYNQTSQCGPRYSAGFYDVTFGSSVGVCGFSSSEIAGDWRLPGPACFDIANGIKLCGLEFANDGLASSTGFRYSVRFAVKNRSGAGEWRLIYASDLGNVSVFSGAPYVPIDCLSSFTLPIISNNTARDNFHQSVTGLGGGVAACPTSVTVTPI